MKPQHDAGRDRPFSAPMSGGFSGVPCEGEHGTVLPGDTSLATSLAAEKHGVTSVTNVAPLAEVGAESSAESATERYARTESPHGVWRGNTLSWMLPTGAPIAIAAEGAATTDGALLLSQLAAILHAGGLLSNCAFNLAQRDHLKPDERTALDESRRAWDSAACGYSREAFRAALLAAARPAPVPRETAGVEALERTNRLLDLAAEYGLICWRPHTIAEQRAAAEALLDYARESAGKAMVASAARKFADAALAASSSPALPRETAVVEAMCNGFAVLGPRDRGILVGGMGTHGELQIFGTTREAEAVKPKWATIAPVVIVRGNYDEIAAALAASSSPAVPAASTAGEGVTLALVEKLAECHHIFAWLLGEHGDFPERPERVEGKPYPHYWWRNELRQRVAALASARQAAQERAE